MADFASQAKATNALRPHAVPLLAIALACEEAVTAAIGVAFLPARQPRYERKMHGYWAATMWSEAARTWSKTLPDRVVRLHEPYDWTELIINDSLHARIEREHRSPGASARRLNRAFQGADLTLPVPLRTSTTITNVDLWLQFSKVTGQVSGLAIGARLGRAPLWPTQVVPVIEGHRLLASWQRREQPMPWLEDLDHLAGLTIATPATKEQHAPHRFTTVGATPPGATFTGRSKRATQPGERTGTV